MVKKECIFPRALNVVQALILSVFFLSSCEKDVIAPAVIDDGDADTNARAIYSSREVYFNQPNGQYSEAQAEAEMGDIVGWDAASTYISSNELRIRLLANTIGTAGGMESRIDISDSDEYWLEYRVRFDENFDWSKGGKAGWGFQVGDGVTGCRSDDARASLGGSMRLTWYNNGNDVYLEPYVYHSGMTTRCGDKFGARYPSTGSISRNTWYTVGFYFKANTGTSYNGVAEMKVNGVTVLRKNDVQWSTTDAKRIVKGLYFSVFRGGSTSDWGSTSTGYIYFDNLKWQKM